MNLAKLLAAGKSFVAARDGEHRYRLNRIALPKFISPRNPFASPERANAPSTKKPPTPSAAPAPAGPDAAAAPGSARLRRVAEAMAAGARRWRQQLKRFATGRRLRADAARRKPEAAPVQRELALEQVRVVRNDLRDEDIEVVVRQPAAVVDAKGGGSPRWGVVGRAWERLSSRFSTVNQT